MAKRFIDTDLFDDPWFMDLSKDGKIFWIYLLTKCDHAGVIDLNKKLAQFQTDINCLDTVIEELGNRLVTVREQLYFIPKFLEFQYPGFPGSKAKAQISALEILRKNKIDFNSYLTVPEGLPNPYGNGKGKINGISSQGGLGGIDFKKFIDVWNDITEFPKLVTISDERKEQLNFLAEEYGKENIYKMIDKAAKSKYLNGGNDKGWKATFDWLFVHSNFIKVLEGNFDNSFMKKKELGYNL